MDSNLMFIGMLLFAALYIGLAVTLFWTLLLCILVMIVYIGVRYKNVAEHYPYNVGEVLSTISIVGVIWVIFVLVGPKPIPFLTGSFTYNTLPESTLSDIITVFFVFLFVMMIIIAAIIPWLEGRGGVMGGSGGGGGEGQAAVGVGA